MNQKSLSKNKIISLALFVLSVLLVFVISEGSLLNLPNFWGREEYGHGYLIPILSAFLAWHFLTEKKPEIKPSWLGLVFLLFGFFVSAFAELSAFQSLLNYGFLISFTGICFSFFGLRFVYVISPALIFLLFAVPLPEIIFSNISVNMQLVSSTLGTFFIRLAGFSVFQDGNIIDLGYMKLQVVEACNGLRYLFPLMSLGFLMALMMDDTWLKKAIVFLSTIPITIFMNSLRIGMIGVTVNLWGKGMAEGLLHLFEGFVVFGLCLAVLIAEVWVLSKVTKSGRFKDEYLRLPENKLPRYQLKLGAVPALCVLMCLSMAIFFHYGAIKNRNISIPNAPNFSEFPLEMDNWIGRRAYLTSEEAEILNLSDYWMANYSTKSEDIPVNLYVAYYDSQRMRQSVHMPLNCIFAGGWEIKDQSKQTIAISGQAIPIVRLIASKGIQKVMVYYWLEQRGRQINDSTKAKLYLALDSISMNRTDGGLVRVITQLGNDEDEQDAEKRLNSFLEKAYTPIQQFIPGKDMK